MLRQVTVNCYHQNNNLSISLILLIVQNHILIILQIICITQNKSINSSLTLYMVKSNSKSSMINCIIQNNSRCIVLIISNITIALQLYKTYLSHRQTFPAVLTKKGCSVFSVKMVSSVQKHPCLRHPLPAVKPYSPSNHLQSSPQTWLLQSKTP